MTEISLDTLNRKMSAVMADIFTSNNGSFLAPIMCGVEIIWDKTTKIAATDGMFIMWNPDVFLALNFRTRKFIMLHELWHIALLHCTDLHLMSQEEALLHNYAADIYINGNLIKDGEVCENIRLIHCPAYTGMGIEEILAILKSNMPPLHMLTSNGSSGNCPNPQYILDQDALPNSELSEEDVMQSLIAARNDFQNNPIKSASVSDMVAYALEIIEQKVEPSVDWEVALQHLLTELGIEDYSWNIKDRRFNDVYLPSLIEEADEGKLVRIQFYLDTSASISLAQEVTFVSNVIYVKETYDPDELQIIFFDDAIRKVITYTKEDTIESIQPYGGGGTDFAPVREHIITTKPIAACIFSDMETSPMKAIPEEDRVPIVWVAMTKNKVTVPHGTIHYIRK